MLYTYKILLNSPHNKHCSSVHQLWHLAQECVSVYMLQLFHLECIHVVPWECALLILNKHCFHLHL